MRPPATKNNGGLPLALRHYVRTNHQTIAGREAADNSVFNAKALRERHPAKAGCKGIHLCVDELRAWALAKGQQDILDAVPPYCDDRSSLAFEPWQRFHKKLSEIIKQQRRSDQSEIANTVHNELADCLPEAELLEMQIELSQLQALANEQAAETLSHETGATMERALTALASAAGDVDAAERILREQDADSFMDTNYESNGASPLEPSAGPAGAKLETKLEALLQRLAGLSAGSRGYPGLSATCNKMSELLVTLYAPDDD